MDIGNVYAIDSFFCCHISTFEMVKSYCFWLQEILHVRDATRWTHSLRGQTAYLLRKNSIHKSSMWSIYRPHRVGRMSLGDTFE